MKFAEFHVDQVIEAGPYPVAENEIIKFAEAYDPQWFHTDSRAAAKGPFEGLIASGWQTCSIAMRLVVDAVLKDSESYASPGIKNLKWVQPVRPGDELSLRLTVLDVRNSNKRPEIGIIEWRWQLSNQDAVEVLELDVTSLFKLDGEQSV